MKIAKLPNADRKKTIDEITLYKQELKHEWEKNIETLQHEHRAMYIAMRFHAAFTALSCLAIGILVGVFL